MISISAHLTPEKFLKTAGPWLEKNEPQNNLILGIASNIASKPLDQRQEYHFWVVKKGKEIAGAAFWTPPFKLSLTEMESDALIFLARKLVKQVPLIPGVNGPKEILPTFIRAWNAPGLQAEIETSSRLYHLEKVGEVPPVGGEMRIAGPEETDRLTQWFKLFREELRAPEKLDEREWVGGYIREQRLFVWNHGQACAMAGYAGITPNGARIVMVYTPRGLRKRGYATNLVASLSQKLLQGSRKFCVLYTDLLNPTSNHIYQKIGYLPVCDWDSYSFQAFKGLLEGE